MCRGRSASAGSRWIHGLSPSRSNVIMIAHRAPSGQATVSGIVSSGEAEGRARTTAGPYNWLAYAIRKNGNPSAAIPIYQKALAIDPKHKGAHEYIGEAYLMLDDLPHAKEHLKTLDSLCFITCEEFRDLRRAVEA